MPIEVQQNPNVPTLEIRTRRPEEETPLTDEELLLASPILYGFSLSDKIWRTSPIYPCHEVALSDMHNASRVQR